MIAALKHSNDRLWEDFLVLITPKLSRHVVETWMRPIQFQSFIGGVVTLAVADQFSRDWLNDHYLSFIRDHLAELIGAPVAVDWLIDSKIAARNTIVEHANEDTSEVPESADPANDKRRHLNSRYVFDTFVAGPSNQFAYAACKAVSEKPAKAYNPLFLFGVTGLGKTHLLSAIGHQILRDCPSTRVIYTSSEQFMNEVINAVRFSTLDEFHQKYRKNCDILLMDDIQLIAGKERTQHEFFHIFNTLYDSQRQIVVTSDKLPHEIPEIEDRLRTRFQWGLIADIQPPEIETRIAILRKKAENEKIAISNDVVFFLAQHIRTNVRELEGALVRVVAHASLTRMPVSVEYARDILADVISNKINKVSIESIQKIVASYFQIRVSDLKSNRRVRLLVKPRQIAMYLCRKHAGASYPELGSRFGNKDHTTVMSAYRKMEAQLLTDSILRNQMLELEKKLDLLQ
jgi:chromosomal replication initiator protein